MQAFLEAMEKEKKQLIQLIAHTEKRLKKRPVGNIKATHHGKYFQYYYIDPEERKTSPDGKFIRKKDLQFATALVQKEYEEQIIKSAKEQLYILNKISERYASLEPHQIYIKLNNARKHLVIPAVYEPDWHPEKWKRTKYKKKLYAEENTGFYTHLGEHVRSKSEQIIADEYNYEGIPYRYEEEIVLKDGTVLHPDFTVLNKRTGKIYYHEHLGMLGDEEYSGMAIERINTYIRNGIFPGDKLIITAESMGKPFDSRTMIPLIQEYLK